MRKTMQLSRCGNMQGWWKSGAVVVCLTLSGCLAQQADLVETRTDLDQKIAALNKKEQEIRDRTSKLTEQSASLGAQITDLQNEAISKIEGTQEKQNKRIEDIGSRLDNQLLKARLENDRRVSESEKTLKEQLASLKAEFGTRIGSLEGGIKDQGKGLEDQAKVGREDQARLQENLVKLRTRLEETNASVLEVTKRMEVRMQEHDRALGAGDAKVGGVAQQLDQQNRSVTDQLVQFSRALADFKIVLTGLADKLTQQEHVTQELAADLSKRSDVLAAKTDTDAKATSTHLIEVNRSIASVAKAVENLSVSLGARIDQQDQKLNEMSGAVHNVTAHIQQQDQKLSEMAGAFQNVTAQIQQQDQRLAEMTTPSATSSTSTPRRDSQESVGTKRNGKAHKRNGPSESEPRAPQVSALDADQQEPVPAAGDVITQPLSTIEASATTGISEVQNPQPPKPPAREVYEALLVKFRQGDLQGAQQGFSDFLVQYPTSDLAPNAQYWLGECYYGRRDYRRAIDAFNQVRHTYPRSEKAPAALLKASFAYIEVNERARAAALLKEILESYPKSPEAGKAGAKLAQLERKR